jgi:hypothetical protein
LSLFYFSPFERASLNSLRIKNVLNKVCDIHSRFPAPDEIAKTVFTARILESIKTKGTELQETYFES